MFVRDAPTDTLEEIREQLDAQGIPQSIDTSTDLMRVDLVRDRALTIESEAKKKPVILPLTSTGRDYLASYMQIPKAFLKRIDDDLAQYVLNEMLSRSEAPVRVTYTDMGIEDLCAPHISKIDPRTLVDIAMRVITPEAPVVDWWRKPEEFRFDCIVPEGYDRGIGGDKPRGKSVGDLTLGGLRFGHDTEKNLAPNVQKYFYRLVCTNGMECQDLMLKVDARGQTTDEVLEELEIKAQVAFGEVEKRIKEFYAMRNEVVPNPAELLLRIGKENNFTDRMITTMQSHLANVRADEGDVSLFDVTNVITNLANDPKIVHKVELRQRLEQIGGSLVTEHAQRCRTCSSRV